MGSIVWFAGKSFTSHFHEVSALHNHLKRACSKKRISLRTYFTFYSIQFKKKKLFWGATKAPLEHNIQSVRVIHRGVAVKVQSQLQGEVKFWFNPQGITDLCCCLQLLPTIVSVIYWLILFQPWNLVQTYLCGSRLELQTGMFNSMEFYSSCLTLLVKKKSQYQATEVTTMPFYFN